MSSRSISRAAEPGAPQPAPSLAYAQMREDERAEALHHQLLDHRVDVRALLLVVVDEADAHAGIVAVGLGLNDHLTLAADPAHLSAQHQGIVEGGHEQLEQEHRADRQGLLGLYE